MAIGAKQLDRSAIELDVVSSTWRLMLREKARTEVCAIVYVGLDPCEAEPGCLIVVEIEPGKAEANQLGPKLRFFKHLGSSEILWQPMLAVSRENTQVLLFSTQGDGGPRAIGLPVFASFNAAYRIRVFSDANAVLDRFFDWEHGRLAGTANAARNGS